ncbi:MAG: YdcH family protein [Candidatus Puniceispirillales bacterium]
MSKDSFDNDIKSQLIKRLEQLTLEHRDLDEVIDQLAQGTNIDILKLQRLKKRKLGIKDEIRIINQKLLPDIIA